MTSSNFWYCSRSKFEFPYLLSNGCTGVISEALISNSSQKIRCKYVLKEKKAIFYEKLKFLPKCSLTKVTRLLLIENYFK